MPEFILLSSQEEIRRQVQKTGQKISADYKDKDLVMVGILKGAFIFMADLSRQINIDHDIDFIGASSYEGTISKGQLSFTKKPDLDLAGRDV
ncbi:MAG: hypoxanthine phosphoribosyltransferase, partial [Proteobacteria bacterium]|nr:hypoxanthine phosphoribosyltransferase [Pseudomonadota bacterium]